MSRVTMGQTVEEAFEIDLNLLADQSEQSPYWQNSFDFYVSVKDKLLDELSEDQLNWLEKIEEEL